jgi:PAS domain-containing protein
LDIVPIARETLLDQMRDAVLVLDSTGLIVDVNQAAQNQLNASPSGWIGKQFSTILPEFSDITLDKSATSIKEKQITLT